MPWRVENQLIGDALNFERRWDQHVADLKATTVEAYDDLMKLIRQQTSHLEMERVMFERRRQNRSILRKAEIEEESGEVVLETFARYVDENKHVENVKSLNDNQREIFDYVTETVMGFENYFA